MKKRYFLLLVLIFVLVGCKSNNVTVDDFISKATFNGYIVESNKSGYEAYSNILDVHYAINRENAYNIQFLELNDESYAHKFFLLNKEDLETNVNSYDYEKTRNTTNYEIYHAETISEYLLVIRCNKNIIYVRAPINYINEIEEFLNEMNLDY